MAKTQTSDLPSELRTLVKESVALLGDVLHDELGEKAYRRIESIRKEMAEIRGGSEGEKRRALQSTYRKLKNLSSDERREFARAYTLMFEVINACENAYRTYRLKHYETKPPSDKASAKLILYVLTAHPTEARAPENIGIFYEIQSELVRALEFGFEKSRGPLKALLALAWKVRIVRYRKPRVRDEAEHLYTVALRDENLSEIFDLNLEHTRVFLRSWIGGDKDGHPGVDSNAMRESLQVARDLLLKYAEGQIRETRSLLELMGRKISPDLSGVRFSKALSQARIVSAGDGQRIRKLHSLLQAWIEIYRSEIGAEPKSLRRLARLFHVFPALVIPLELREDSAVLESDPSGKKLAIGGMLRTLRKISKGADERWYARGMIISMASSAEHVRIAAQMMKKNLGGVRVRVVPLFEQRAAIESGHEIISEVFRDPVLKKYLKTGWSKRFEIMLGYSDSSKESGVLKSRLSVTRAMKKMDRVCVKAGIEPIFFHGSGGSIDRGGGSIGQQMAAWPKNAIKIYKATIQGEMVERSFASPEILRSNLRKITHAKIHRSPPPSKALEEFANQTAARYSRIIESPRFLRMVERATPYRFLSALKIGSRPTKRATSLSVSALRAIPWVLCWTQTRVLFQTWWGVGSAWENLDRKNREELKRTFREDPLFKTYLQALGFTLAKIELPVWEFYLARSGLSASDVSYFREVFRNELKNTWAFFREVTGEKNPVWFRPWLGKSIELRAALIHPLNLLQILAQEDQDLPLLRICATGIASGMLTTG